ncbi:MAG: hypothetical protein JO312_10325 [Hyphomicrobiales bacterium]|nr:hypothetical protein [Hyphomicrobiales bacterium]
MGGVEMLLFGQGQMDFLRKQDRRPGAEPEPDNPIVRPLPNPSSFVELPQRFKRPSAVFLLKSLDQIASPRQTVAEITGDRAGRGLAAPCDQRLLMVVFERGLSRDKRGANRGL